jgi:hypothetical protein
VRPTTFAITLVCRGLVLCNEPLDDAVGMADSDTALEVINPRASATALFAQADPTLLSRRVISTRSLRYVQPPDDEPNGKATLWKT